MSDYSISIVPKLSRYPNKEDKASELLDWLMTQDVVKTTASGCVLGAEYGYAVSKGAEQVTDSPDYLPFELITNGLEIV